MYSFSISLFFAFLKLVTDGNSYHQEKKRLGKRIQAYFNVSRKCLEEVNKTTIEIPQRTRIFKGWLNVHDVLVH